MKTMLYHRSNALYGLLCLTLVLVLPVMACNLPAVGGASPTATSESDLATQVALTVQAELTAQAAQAVVSQTPVPAAPTEMIVLPSQTLAASLTPQPTNTIAATVGPSVPLISASVNTNCRAGPSKLYDPPVGVLLTGQQSEVHGRNDVGTWWYIQTPGRPGKFCWVWTETTSVEGNTANLPIITPPPLPSTPTFTPTPGTTFSLAFSKLNDCNGTPTAILQVNNTGNTGLQSLNLKIDDLTASVTLFGPQASDAPFMTTSDECPPGGDLLPAGDNMYIGGSVGAGNSGHEAKATVKLCTEDGLGGTCAENTLTFTIP
jgi:hypothetical protein